MLNFFVENSLIIAGAILVSIISILGEILLIFLKIVDLEKIRKNKEKISELNKELKKMYEKIKEEKKGIDPKIYEKQKEMLSLNFEIMKEKFKITLLTLIPVLIIFSILYKYEGGFGWWFLIYLLAYFIFDKLFRFFAKKLNVKIDY